jgi:hypothetical protein
MSKTPSKPSTGKKSQRELDAIPASELLFAKEYWTGDSRDGALVNGDGYHFYKMTKTGLIIDAYEYYETEDGVEHVAPLPEMLQVNWVEDLGFDDLDALDTVTEDEFERVKSIVK